MSGTVRRTSRLTPRDRTALPVLDELRALQRDRARLTEEVARLEQMVSELSAPSAANDAGGDDPGKLLLAARRLEACGDRAAVLDALQDIVRHVIGADDYLLLAHDEEGNTLWPMLGAGPNGGAFGPISAHDELVAAVLRTGKRSVGASSDEAGGTGERFDTVACVPLRSAARTVGVLIVFGLEPRRAPMGAADLALLDFLTVHAATALQLADLRAATMHRALSLL